MAKLRRLIRQKAEDNKELDAEVEELTVNVAERHNVEEAQGLSEQNQCTIHLRLHCYINT